MTVNITSVFQKMLLLFLGVAGFYFAKSFLIPLLIGGILAALFLPVCNWMEKRKTPKALAVFFCFLLLIAIIAGLIALVSWKISEVLQDLALVKQKAAEGADYVQTYIFNHLGLTIEEQIRILKSEQPSLAGILHIILGSLTNFLTSFVLVFIYFLFLLYYRIHIKNFILKLAPPDERDEMEKVIYSASTIAQQYLVGFSKMIFCLWIMYGIGFSIIGVKNAIFFAILCGILEIIPFIGNITGTTLTVIVTALHGGSYSMLGAIVLTYGTIQFIQGFILEPLLVGPQVKINSFFTIVALVLGELLWGIPGIILAIPVTAIFKIACDHIDPLKPYGYLMGVTETGNTGLLEKIKMIFKK